MKNIKSGWLKAGGGNGDFSDYLYQIRSAHFENFLAADFTDLKDERLKFELDFQY